MTSIAEAPARSAPAEAGLQIVDCDIHPAPADRRALNPYLSARWRRHLDDYGGFAAGVYQSRNAYPRFQPAAARRDAWPPAGGPPGSDLAFLQRQHLDPYGVRFGILEPLIEANTSRNVELAAAVCAATNDWQLETFAGPDPRLKASIQIAAEDTDAAVAEIRRRADDRRFAQIQLGTRSIEPYGRRRYWPIFAVAEETGFPVGFHIGGPAFHAPTAGGWPSHYIEYHHVVSHSAQAQVASLLLEGVFERFPRLKVVMIECGLAWIPAFTWRLDRHFERLRSEVPHLRRRPSEYLRESVWFTTQPIDEPERTADLRRLLDWIGWDRLLFSSDYPHWDFDDPRRALPMPMSAEERRCLFHDNAIGVYPNLEG